MTLVLTTMINLFLKTQVRSVDEQSMWRLVGLVQQWRSGAEVASAEGSGMLKGTAVCALQGVLSQRMRATLVGDPAQVAEEDRRHKLQPGADGARRAKAARQGWASGALPSPLQPPH